MVSDTVRNVLRTQVAAIREEIKPLMAKRETVRVNFQEAKAEFDTLTAKIQEQEEAIDELNAITGDPSCPDDESEEEEEDPDPEPAAPPTVITESDLPVGEPDDDEPDDDDVDFAMLGPGGSKAEPVQPVGTSADKKPEPKKPATWCGRAVPHPTKPAAAEEKPEPTKKTGPRKKWDYPTTEKECADCGHIDVVTTNRKKCKKCKGKLKTVSAKRQLDNPKPAARNGNGSAAVVTKPARAQKKVAKYRGGKPVAPAKNVPVQDMADHSKAGPGKLKKRCGRCNKVAYVTETVTGCPNCDAEKGLVTAWS